MIIINIDANYDIQYYLSNSASKYADQTVFEINSMLYLSQLLSVYDGNATSKWGYLFTRNKFGAPISAEIIEELDLLLSNGVLCRDKKGYYRLSSSMPESVAGALAKSYRFAWRAKYILASIDSLLTKPFPKVIDAILNEPGITLLELLDRTSVLHGDASAGLLFEDFKCIREAVNDPSAELVVPASLWIDCLAMQVKENMCDD